MLNKLTPAQEARLPEIRDEWLGIGLSTEPIDRERARDAVALAYECAGLKPPETFVFLRSPLEGVFGAHLMSGLWNQVWAQVGPQVEEKVARQVRDQVLEQVRAQVRTQVGDQVAEQVRAQIGEQVAEQVWAQVGEQVRDQVREQVGEQAGEQVWAQVRDQVLEQVRAQVWAQVAAQVGARVRDQVRTQVREQVWAQVGAQVGAEVREQVVEQVWDQVWAPVAGQVVEQARDQVAKQVWNAVYGSLDAAHGAWCAAYREFGVLDGKADGLIAATREAGWYWPFSGCCVVTDRPELICMSNGVLHSETGPAIRYRDGFAVYAWNGVVVPQEWIENRETLDPVEVLKCENVEQRAAGVAILGMARVAEKLKQRVIDGDPDTTLGALVEVDLPGLPEPGLYLRAVCPRNGPIMEGVPVASDIDGSPIRTARAAQAWRQGLTESEFQPAPVRT